MSNNLEIDPDKYYLFDDQSGKILRLATPNEIALRDILDGVELGSQLPQG